MIKKLAQMNAFLRFVFIGLVGLLGFTFAAFNAAKLFGVYYNESRSAPAGLWLSERLEPIEIDDWVLACIDISNAMLAKQRGYLPAGDCPGAVAPVLKRVIAVEKDVVRINQNGVTINGKTIEGSKQQSTDSQGRPMPIADYQKVLQSGEFWLMGNEDLSFDSRYFGVVDGRVSLAKLWISFDF